VLKDLLIQGGTGISLWKQFPNKCQKQDVPSTYWTAPTPSCAKDENGDDLGDSVEPSAGPHFDPDFNFKYEQLLKDLAQMKATEGDTPAYKTLNATAISLKTQYDPMPDFLARFMGAVPATLTKQSPDMQNFYVALLNAPDDPGKTLPLGVLYGPSALDATDKKVRKYLGVPIGLAPSVTYNVNAQNEVVNSLLSAPTTAQRTLIAAIPLTFAEPRFESSAGVFLSLLHNRTFANTTDVSITTTGTSQTPVPTDVKITETVTNPPLLIPYYAAHLRIAPEWLYPKWMGGRRGAFYATGALAINPYLTDLEYGFGFGVSWRYLMFSPVYNLGRSTRLTQDEQVGQVWCTYPGAPNPTMAPPCSSAPPAPTTKTFMTGAFAIGIGVRIPTTFSSTNK
jgi:hypothetical protein